MLVWQGVAIDPIQPQVHLTHTQHWEHWTEHVDRVSMETSPGPLQAGRVQLSSWDRAPSGHKMVSRNGTSSGGWGQNCRVVTVWLGPNAEPLSVPLIPACRTSSVGRYVQGEDCSSALDHGPALSPPSDPSCLSCFRMLLFTCLTKHILPVQVLDQYLWRPCPPLLVSLVMGAWWTGSGSQAVRATATGAARKQSPVTMLPLPCCVQGGGNGCPLLLGWAGPRDPWWAR